MFSFHLPPPPTAPVLSCHVLFPCCFKKWPMVPIAYHVLDRDLPSLAFTDRKSSLPSPMLMWSGEDGMKDLLLPCSSPVKSLRQQPPSLITANILAPSQRATPPTEVRQADGAAANSGKISRPR